MNALVMEWYIAQIRDRIKDKLKIENFFGNIKFEVNIKDGTIVNMNYEQKESIRQP